MVSLALSVDVKDLMKSKPFHPEATEMLALYMIYKKHIKIYFRCSAFENEIKY